MAGTTSTNRVVGITGGTPAPLDFPSTPRDVTEDFYAVHPDEIPFIARLGGFSGDFTVGSRRDHEWIEEDLWKNRLTLSSTTGLSSTDGTTMTLSAADAYRVAPGSTLMVDTEKMYISAIASTTTLTIVRDAFGTTAATHATAATVYVYGVAREEGTASPFIGSPTKTVFTNYMQFMEQAYKITEQAANVTEYGRKPIDIIRETIMRNLASGAENQAINGTAFAGASAEPPTFGGALAYITSANGSYNTDVASAALTEANLYTAARSIMNNVGEANVARTICVRFFLHQKIGSFFENRVRTTVGDHTGGVSIGSIDTAIGTWEIMHFYNWPDTTVGFINFDSIHLGHYAGMPAWRQKALASDGVYDLETRYADLCSELRNPQRHGQITSVSVSS